MHGASVIQKTAVLTGLLGGVDAFWRMPLREMSGLGRIDPIVSPGETSAHVHAIFGSGGFSENPTYDDLVGSDCTTAQVTQDRSAYWTPALYFLDASTGQYEMVGDVGGMLGYYFLNPNTAEGASQDIYAFKEGFKMLAGTSDLRTFPYPVPDVDKSAWAGTSPYNTQAFLEQAAIGFNCLNYAIAAEGSLYRHFLPDKAYLDANCLDGVRMELMFPSCWNESAGVAPADGKSHMAYPSEVITGSCPDGFDTKVPGLFYETIWNTAAFIGRDGSFVISNNDALGYGYHGDFIMGWESEAFLQSAVDECTNASGEIQDCPVFTIQEEYTECNFTMPAALVNENVLGPISALPGGDTVSNATASASISVGLSLTLGSSSAMTTSSAASVVPTLSYSSGVSQSSSFVPGGIFIEVTSSTSSSASAATTTSSVAPVVTSSIVHGAFTDSNIYSTSYSTTTSSISPLNAEVEVNEVVWVSEIVTVTEAANVEAVVTSMVTAVDQVQAMETDVVTVTQVARRKRHLHGHQKGGHYGDGGLRR